MPKLTLHVDETLIAAAKQEAASRNVSVSKLVSDFFRNFTAQPGENSEAEKLAPRTKRLAGLLDGHHVDKEDYIEYLEKKYS